MSKTRPLTGSRLATLAGAKFLGGRDGRFSKTMFRPTAMSIALAAAGVIPGTHMVSEQPARGVLRNRNDMTGFRPSVHVSL